MNHNRFLYGISITVSPTVKKTDTTPLVESENCNTPRTIHSIINETTDTIGAIMPLMTGLLILRARHILLEILNFLFKNSNQFMF